MDYDDFDDVREPIPSYTDRLIPQDDIDKAIEESLKSTHVNDEIDIVIKQSLKDYEEKGNEDIDLVLIKSLEEFEEKENMNEELEIIMQSSLESYNNEVEIKLLNDTYLDFLTKQPNEKQEKIEKISNFVSQIKRLIGLQKNDTLNKLLIILENYSNEKINEITVSKDEYKKIFNEIKNIRHTTDVFDTLKSIIIVSSDIDL
jgi:hypothetical protein